MNLRSISVAMKISKSTIALLVLILIFSILMANIADFISIDPHLPDETSGDNNGEIQWSGPKFYNIENSYDHLIWFLQVCRFPYLGWLTAHCEFQLYFTEIHYNSFLYP